METLTRRLAECPAEFLSEPRAGRSGQVSVAAVVADLLHDLGGPELGAAQAQVFQPRSAQQARERRNWLSAVLVVAWLLHDPWFIEARRLGPAAAEFLSNGLNELAGLTQAPQLIGEPDRREELARLCLRGLGLRPAGETPAQAADRLATLSTAERQRVLAASRQAEERTRAIREAMAKKAAEEAAAQYSRE